MTRSSHRTTLDDRPGAGPAPGTVPDEADRPAQPAPDRRHERGPGGERSPEPDRMGVSGTQVAASVLASVSAAIVASLFGVAGTVAGAAVVSVVATIGSAAYGLGLRRTTARLQKVQALQAVQVLRTTRSSPAVRATRADDPTGPAPVTGADVRAGARPDTGGPDTGRQPGTAPPADDADDAGVPGAAPDDRVAGTGPSWLDRLARRRLTLAGGLALVLALSFGLVSLVEVVTDGPLAGGASGGRTSIGALISGDDDPAPTTSTSTTSTTVARDGEAPASPTTTTAPDDRGDEATTTTEPSTTTTTSRSTTTTPPTTASPTPAPPGPGADPGVPPATP